MFFLSSEWLFWGGIGIMVFSVLGGIFFMILFILTGKILKRKLEQDYGKPQD